MVIYAKSAERRKTMYSLFKLAVSDELPLEERYALARAMQILNADDPERFVSYEKKREYRRHHFKARQAGRPKQINLTR